METRTLGRTGRTVGAVGFAGSTLITPAHGLVPRDVLAVLVRALDLGVSVIDMPEGAEAMVGEAVREQRARERAVVTIEVASGGPRAMMARVEAALRGGRFEVIPLALLRGDLDFAHPAMEQMVREGKVLAWGAIVDDDVPDDPLIACVKLTIARGAADAIAGASAAVARGLGVLTSSSLDDLGWTLAQPVTCAIVELRRPEDLEHL